LKSQGRLDSDEKPQLSSNDTALHGSSVPEKVPRERPILFSGPMVRAILAGRKTQTRRVYKPREGSPYEIMDELPDGQRWPHWFSPNLGPEYYPVACPYGQPGDRLWVRERAAYFDAAGRPSRPSEATYALFADGTQKYRDGTTFPFLAEYAPAAFEGIHWRPSIHMPRWASRLTLEVVSVRVERLHGITEEDARAEGVEAIGVTFQDDKQGRPHIVPSLGGPYRDGFRILWSTIHGGGAWEANPFCWVVEFRRVTP